MTTVSELLKIIDATVSQINSNIEKSSVSFDKLQAQASNVAKSMLDAATQTERVTNASNKVEPGAQGFAGGSGATANNYQSMLPQYYENDISGVLKASSFMAEEGILSGNSEKVTQAINQLQQAIDNTQTSLDLTTKGVQNAQNTYDASVQSMNNRIAQAESVINNPSASKSAILAAVRDKGFAGSENVANESTLARMKDQQQAQQAEIDRFKGLIDEIITAQAKANSEGKDEYTRSKISETADLLDARNESVGVDNYNILKERLTDEAKKTFLDVNGRPLTDLSSLTSSNLQEAIAELAKEIKGMKQPAKDTGQVYTVNFNLNGKQMTMRTTQDPEDFIAALERAQRTST